MTQALLELFRAGMVNAGESDSINLIQKLNEKFGIGCWSFVADGVQAEGKLVLHRSNYISFLLESKVSISVPTLTNIAPVVEKVSKEKPEVSKEKPKAKPKAVGKKGK